MSSVIGIFDWNISDRNIICLTEPISQLLLHVGLSSFWMHITCIFTNIQSANSTSIKYSDHCFSAVSQTSSVRWSAGEGNGENLQFSPCEILMWIFWKNMSFNGWSAKLAVIAGGMYVPENRALKFELNQILEENWLPMIMNCNHCCSSETCDCMLSMGTAGPYPFLLWLPIFLA